MHRNWTKTNFYELLEQQAGKRTLKNLSVGPILSWNNEKIKAHIDAVMELEGAKILFGGKPLTEAQWRAAKDSVKTMILRGIGAI